MDQITVSVIANRLKAIGQQMGTVIERSAHSPLLVEGRDFSLGIYDQDGTLIEQTEYIPILGYASAPGVREVIRYFKDDVQPGDVFLHNDPFSGGNQISDWKVIKPVFFNGELVAWTAITGHQADVGGAVPGSYNPHATDIWQEGLRVTPLKIVEKGRLRQDVWDLLLANVRLSVVGDDIKAMIGGCTVGERELITLFEEFGLETFNSALNEIFLATEKMTKAIIAKIPNGEYQARWWVYDDGFDHEAKMNIDVAVKVTDHHITFDFTGTHPQTKGYVNAPLPVTISSVMITFFMLADQEIPHNDAILKYIDVIVPEGCMLNPKFPAASGFGNHLSDQICTAIMLALQKAMPDNVTAGWNPLLASIINGQDPRTGKPYVDIMINACKGGSGGTKGANGYDHIGLIASGGALAAQDPEMFEITNPHFLHKFEYITDSAGAGKWRGGLGVETVFEIQTDGAQISVFGDGITDESAAPGILGGYPGIKNRITLHYPDGTIYHCKSKELISDVPYGTVYQQIAGGGGGYGDPRLRPVKEVAEDVRNGLVSEKEAKDKYGVVFINSKKGIVDEKKTKALRNMV